MIDIKAQADRVFNLAKATIKGGEGGSQETCALKVRRFPKMAVDHRDRLTGRVDIGV